MRRNDEDHGSILGDVPSSSRSDLSEEDIDDEAPESKTGVISQVWSSSVGGNHLWGYDVPTSTEGCRLYGYVRPRMMVGGHSWPLAGDLWAGCVEGEYQL